MSYDPELLEGFDVDEFYAERRAQRRHHRAYLAHPDPQDPDHPGEYEGEGNDE